MRDRLFTRRIKPTRHFAVVLSDDEFRFFDELEGKLISVVDASQIEVNGESLSVRQLQRLIQEGKVSGMKLGRMYITSHRAVQDYLNTDRRPGPKTD